MRPRRTRLPGLVVCLAAALSSGLVAAQSFPNRPLRLIVPFPTGGGTDTTARAVSDILAAGLGQPVLVENRPGGGTVVGGEIVAKAPADGYTLLLAAGDIIAIDQAFGNRLPYDPVKDFTVVGGLASLSIMLVAGPNAGVKSVRDIVTKARAAPGKLTFASIGSSSPHYLFFEWFKRTAGIDVSEIPYKGTMQGVTDVVGGRVDMVFFAEMNAMRFASAGKLVPIAVTGDRRSPFAPEIPTFAESGYPELVMYNWFALAAPAGLPREIAATLSAQTEKAVRHPDVATRLAGAGLLPWPSTPDQIAETLKRDTERYRQIIRVANVKPEGR